jgi:hypothetical protein
MGTNMQVYFCVSVCLYYYIFFNPMTCHLCFLLINSCDSWNWSMCLAIFWYTYCTVQFSRIITTPLTPKFNFSLTSVSQWSTFSFLVYSCEVFLFSHTFWNIVITFLVYFFTFLCPSIFLPLFCCLSRMFVMKKLLIIMMRCCEWLSLNTSHRGTLHWSVSDHTRNSLAYFVCRKSNRRIASKSFSW